MKNVGNNSKLSEVSLTCLVDLCRAAAYVDAEGDVPLRLIAPDVAHEIKVCNSWALFVPNALINNTVVLLGCPVQLWCHPKTVLGII